MPRTTLSRCVSAALLGVLALVFGGAAWERFRLPLTPYADPDVWAYLTPGLSKLLGTGFQHMYGQCFLYPGFLYVLLRVGGDFRWITGIQHLLGLGTGALLFGCWLELRRFLPAPHLPAFLFKLLGALLVAVYLFSTATIEFEQALRPEAIFPFFVALNIFCVLRFVRARFLDRQGRRAVLISGGGAIFFSVVASLFKPSFSVALLLANLPLLISLFRAGQSVRDKAALVGIPTLAALLLLILPEWKLRQSDPWGTLFLAQSLFSIHADLIDAQLAEDVQRQVVTPFRSDLVAATHIALREALADSRATASNWPALGFNPDYLIYGSDTKPAFMRWLAFLWGDRQKVEFLQYYYRRTFREHPAWMGAKILRQIGVFYQFRRCPVYVTYPTRDFAANYRESAVALATSAPLRQYPPGVALIARTEALRTRAIPVGPFPMTLRVDRLLAASYLTACLWSVLLGIIAWRSGLFRRAFGAVAPVLLLLYAYNFGTVLTLAIGHSLDVGRYSGYQLAYTLLPEFAAGWLAFEAVVVAGFGLVGLEAVAGEHTWRPMRSPAKFSLATARQKAAVGLPTLAGSGEAPSVGVVILAEQGGEHSVTGFPGARVVPPNGNILDALEGMDADVLLMIDAQAGHSADAARRMVAAYAAAPADMIGGRDEADRRAVTMLSAFVLRVVFGWSPRDPFSGVWVCSRRFYRSVPWAACRDARALELAVLVQGFDKGFSIQETSLLAVDSTEGNTGRVDARHHLPGSDARLLGNLLTASARCQPLKVLGTLGLALVVLGVSLAYSPLNRMHLTRYHINPARVLTAAVSSVLGLLSIQAGWMLDVVVRRSREADQIRLRKGEQ